MSIKPNDPLYQQAKAEEKRQLNRIYEEYWAKRQAILDMPFNIVPYEDLSVVKGDYWEPTTRYHPSHPALWSNLNFEDYVDQFPSNTHRDRMASHQPFVIRALMQGKPVYEGNLQTYPEAAADAKSSLLANLYGWYSCETRKVERFFFSLFFNSDELAKEILKQLQMYAFHTIEGTKGYVEFTHEGNQFYALFIQKHAQYGHFGLTQKASKDWYIRRGRYSHGFARLPLMAIPHENVIAHPQSDLRVTVITTEVA